MIAIDINIKRRTYKATNNPNYKHGAWCGEKWMYKLYHVYHSMRQRCNNPNQARYHDYGGRGITVGNDFDTFDKFKEWSISHGYHEGLQLDRIDNNKGYTGDNCRYVTSLINANNTRHNHIVEYNGTMCSLKEVSRITGINYSTLKNRMNRSNMTIEEAVSIPVRVVRGVND